MNDYIQNYLHVLKNNFMLVIMASVLLVLTFFIWAGFPVFTVGLAVAGLTTNSAIVHFSISLSGGLLFSLYFVPFNLKVAKRIAKINFHSVQRCFVRIQIIWIIVCSIIFEIIMNVVMQ
ncbi:hypothetical protein HNQ35_002551 [Cerasibacillus quisquiliarum]|uniref:Uncharacterized protein n=1 Tax=Cerasibacillus quisquiliarum TaxID=227865 RepID=A0A511V2I9_9BACI|nr:hypothetical protein [Cerasibacillus quisquiliarum]GEN32098.1 hypothetical protein CQU01_23360 [Cerasibacillus quisquiliarum]